MGILEDVGIPRSLLTAQGQILFASGPQQPAVLDPSTIDYLLATKGVGANPAFIEAGDILGSLRGWQLHMIDNFSTFEESVEGTGYTFRDLVRAECRTGDDAASLACIYEWLYIHATDNYSTSYLKRDMNWDRAVDLTFFGRFSPAEIAGARFGWMRFANDITGGDLAQEGVGFRYHRSGFKLFAQSHDGGGLESTEIVTGSVLLSQVLPYRIRHYPGDKVEFYWGGNLLATHTSRVPAGTATNGACVSIGAENVAHAFEATTAMERFLLALAWT